MKEIEYRIDLLLQVFQLASTVYEGMSYLLEHPADKGVLADTQAGLCALRPYFEAERLDKLSCCVGNMPNGQSDQLRQMAGRFFEDSLEGTCAELLKCLKDVPSIQRPAAEKLFRFWDAVPHSCAATYQLIFDTCDKASLSAPLEAFQHTMRLFEEQPGVLSGDNTAHPGYVYRPSEQRVFDKCPICGGEGTPYYRALSYRMSDFSYPDLPVKLWMKCGGCGDLYTWKFPEGYLTREIRSETIEPDPERYQTALGQTSGGSLAAWCAVLNRLNKYTNGTDLLEVGIGSGELLSVALEMGYNAEAVEISPEAAKKVSDILNIPIWVGDFLNYTSEKRYSIITMGDVLEHIAEPARALSIAHHLLAEDDVLWLSTPNYESSFSKMRKFSDPMWREPHHISYFSYRGLKVLARRCGFTIREYNVSNRYNGSMELVLTKRQEM